MATIGSANRPFDDLSGNPPPPDHGILQGVLSVMRPLGSLKLTVTLFAVSLLLVMAGTLAQEELNLEQVKQRYFTSWIAKLYLDDLIPQVFFPNVDFPSWVSQFWLPFPGGALTGTLLLINLLAAKITRFHARARGTRLAAGLAALGVGFAMMIAVIFSGNSSEGVQGEPPFSYRTLWYAICAVVMLSWAGLLVLATTAQSSRARNFSIFGVAAVGLLLVGMLSGYATLGDPGMRILWQLTKGTGVALVMMLGCHLIFGKQGGNVLLHFGVALLMVGQFAYGDRQLEQKLQLDENEVSNTLINISSVELAFLDDSDPEATQVVAIPASRLQAVAGTGETISDPALPFDVRVPSFMVNSELIDAKKVEKNLATSGMGSELAVKETRMEGGATSQPNVSSAYVELLVKDSGESLGTFLVTQYINDGQSLFATDREDELEEVTAGETTYKMGLRYQRIAKPYFIKLLDVRRNDYAGDSKAQSFSSTIRLIDPRSGEDRKERIWMNNPLRYRGETFYQADYVPLPGGKERTGLQVVQNAGWLIPYLACSITGIGMLFHFMGSLGRYISRRDREPRAQASKAYSPLAIGVSLGFVALVVAMKLIPWPAVAMAMNPERAKTTRDLYRAGEIPVQYGGRLMPLDAYARLTLKTLSSKESVPLTEAPTAIINRYEMEEVSPSDLTAYREPGMRERRLPALQWLMEVAAASPELYDLPMFRIDAAEVLAEVGIEKHRKSKLYSINQLLPSIARIGEIADKAREKDAADLSFKERKIIELATRLQLYEVVSEAMQKPRPRDIPAGRLPPDADESERLRVMLGDMQQRMQRISTIPSPGMIPQAGQQDLPRPERKRWMPVSHTFFEALMERFSNPDAVDPTEGFMEMVAAYQENDPLAFNQAIDKHMGLIQPRLADDESNWKLALERWMESAWPSGTAMILYLIVLILALAHLLSGVGALRSSAWAMLTGILAVHTFALIARIVITERPPVINLYSSAVFIGWAAVLYGIVIEYLGRKGIGNLLAATAGAITLMIATRGLSGDDTMPVLQAVLDTQFWLGTHVTTVTLGYSATFASGLLGIIYLVQGWAGAEQETRKEVYRMMYGTTCFGILFSFIGTVLGGLWADDSWGRFWGWDPKENGALLIVIWNALMLHARWDKMVGPRGFAMLAIGGNIVTAWSWFGTNQLGFGLHSYGFTSGTLMWLGIFVGSQLLLILLGWLIHPSRPPVVEEPGWESKRI